MDLARKIKITDTVLRDAHQSLLATRMKTEDMLPIAEMLDKVGYWSVEMWGGATFDSCLRFLKENPWERVRQLKRAMPKTQMQMLLRGQNIVGYRHYSDDVVEAFVHRAHKCGIDVFRIFDALNDPRNLRTAIKVVKDTGAVAEPAVSYTISPVHNTELYVELAKELYSMGADVLCIKDMAGLLAPPDAEKLVRGLKESVDIPVHLHCHATSGMATAAYLKGIEAGADIIDCAISSMSLGTSQPPTETLVSILKGTEYDTGLDISLLAEIAEYFAEIRKKYGEFESRFTGINVKVLQFQIPGGMMSNLVKQLRDQNAMDRMNDVLEEVPKVRRELGYPPLVTPSSQIVGTQATLNVLMGERYKITPTETKNLIKGLYGRSAAPIDPEIKKKVIGDEEIITCRPADLLEAEIDKLKAEVKEKVGTDDIEDVLSYALFPEVASEYFRFRDGGAFGEKEIAAIMALLFKDESRGEHAERPEDGGRPCNAWKYAGRLENMKGKGGIF